MNNKVFYQHPNLMRVLGMHETVMEVMVNVLGGGKSQVLTSLLPCWCSQAGHYTEHHNTGGACSLWKPLI